MHKKFLLILFAICSIFVAQSSSAGQFEALKDVPTAYKGRFRPVEAEGRLWLEEISAGKHSGDADELLWEMHFNGHDSWDNTPFIRLSDAKLKALLDLPETTNLFSYNQLKHSLYDNSETNLRVMRMLLTYNSFKNYRDPSNRGRSEKLELTTLSPNLWVAFKDNSLVVAAAPKSSPWNFLEAGLVLNDNRGTAETFIKANKKPAEEVIRLMSVLQSYTSWHGSETPLETKYSALSEELIAQHTPPQEITAALETQFPLSQRLAQSDSMLRLLPGKQNTGEWLPIKALEVKVYDPTTNKLVPVANFTLYSDEQFNAIRATYLKLSQLIRKKAPEQDIAASAQQLSVELLSSYESIASTPVKQTNGKTLFYPSLNQLSAEKFYYQFSLAPFIIALYAIALTVYCIGYFFKMPQLHAWALVILICAFTLHTVLLTLRIYILDRPPVSNMFETVIYVPWIAVAAGFALSIAFRKILPAIAAATAAIVLLSVLEITHMNNSLENVQAVLDSQYWLIIHVLLVVGSYGAFALCGILGHFYLAGLMIKKTETQTLRFLGSCILQAMYIGLAMLIPGTILGGVWAAESWGRFWDWDPKEAWAFISICTYLICVHAYRFNHIRYFGLAMGSIIGLQVISFTWYGVNYILGTGLHSYGFGSGGDLYYYTFLLAETLFLIFAWQNKKYKVRIS